MSEDQDKGINGVDDVLDKGKEILGNVVEEGEKAVKMIVTEGKELFAKAKDFLDGDDEKKEDASEPAAEEVKPG